MNGDQQTPHDKHEYSLREDIDVLSSGREVLLEVEVFVFIDQPLDSKVVPSARHFPEQNQIREP